jgi:hypothetical protein
MSVTADCGEHIMNPLRFISSPVSDLYKAVVAPFQFIFVVGLCAFINWMTSPGVWWVKWVALGMGIAWIVAWARAAKTLLLIGVVAGVGYFIYKRYGAAAKARYDAWRSEGAPKQPAQAVQYLIDAKYARSDAGSRSAVSGGMH